MTQPYSRSSLVGKLGYSQKHDLVILWNSLTDEWKEKVAEASCVPMGDIREALGQYKDAAVALRYGGSLGEQTAQSPVADTMRKHAAVLQKLANTLGGRAHPAIALRTIPFPLVP